MLVIIWLTMSFFVPIAIAAFVGDDPTEDSMRPSIFNEAPMMTGSIFLAYFGSILLSIGVMITTCFIDHRHSRKNLQAQTLTTIVLAGLFLLFFATGGGVLYLFIGFEIGFDALLAMPIAIVLGVFFYNRAGLSKNSREWLYKIILPSFMVYILIRMGIVVVNNILTNPFLSSTHSI